MINFLYLMKLSPGTWCNKTLGQEHGERQTWNELMIWGNHHGNYPCDMLMFHWVFRSKWLKRGCVKYHNYAVFYDSIGNSSCIYTHINHITSTFLIKNQIICMCIDKSLAPDYPVKCHWFKHNLRHLLSNLTRDYAAHEAVNERPWHISMRTM